jgi:hypothetical protein
MAARTCSPHLAYSLEDLLPQFFLRPLHWQAGTQLLYNGQYPFFPIRVELAGAFSRSNRCLCPLIVYHAAQFLGGCFVSRTDSLRQRA